MSLQKILAIFAPMISKEHISAAYQLIQDEICAALEAVDGKAKFKKRNGSVKAAAVVVRASFKTVAYLKGEA